ncbi:hypothetical protein ACLKA6_003820 [Drosophila palustris]
MGSTMSAEDHKSVHYVVPFGQDRGNFWRWKPENNVLGPISVMATCPSCDTRQQTIVNTYVSFRGLRFTHTCPACDAIIGTYQVES